MMKFVSHIGVQRVLFAVVVALVAMVSGASAELIPLFGLAGTIAASATNPSAYGPAGVYPQRGGATRTFIPQIWTGRFNERFYDTTIWGECANNDFEGDLKLGDEAIIHTVPDATISDYEKGDTLTYEDLDAPNVTMPIDFAKLFAFKIDSIDKYQASPKLMDEFMNNATMRMKLAIDAIVEGLAYLGVAAANQGATAGAVSGDINLGTDGAPLVIDKTNILDFIVDMGVVLGESETPEGSRWIHLPKKMCGLLKKSDLKDASITGDGESVMRNGRLGRIDDLTIYSCNHIAKVGANYKILAGTKAAVTFASQMQEVQHLAQLESTFGQAVRGLNVFGAKVIQPTQIALGTVSI